jgi:hypothetical protein
LKESLGRVKRVFSTDRVVAYSAKTGRGGGELWRGVENALNDFNSPGLD